MDSAISSCWRVARRCNPGMVDLDPLVDEDEATVVHELIARHVVLTDSALGARVLADWPGALARFVVVAPRDFERVQVTEGSRAATEWSDLVYPGAWCAASDRLHASNDFPEFNGLAGSGPWRFEPGPLPSSTCPPTWC